MSMSKNWLSALTAIAVLGAGAPAYAAVSAEEAAKLKTSLTPLGAEKAGNKDGTIPAWDGAQVKSDWKKDLFPQERPRLQITAKNMAEHADMLSDGVKELLKKYPDSYRLDVYPTHRTGTASPWVYENTFKNATQGKITNEGLSVEGVYGGIPFPIPASAQEAMWNHLLRVRPESFSFVGRNFVGTADGKRILASEFRVDLQIPYYLKEGSREKWNGDYFAGRNTQVAPPFKAGESLVIRDSVDPKASRQAWQYLVGQRRVRRAPTVAYDTPDFVSSGANYFDEVAGFFGNLDRFDWKLVGKKELYIPYNNNRFFAAKTDAAFSPHHLNPNELRWEQHRVWVIEATLAAGKRHAVPKRRYYLDEDSWAVVLSDGYDASGQLWRTIQTVPFLIAETPSVSTESTVVYNLQAGSWVMANTYNDLFDQYKVVPRRPDSYFTGDSLAGEGIR